MKTKNIFKTLALAMLMPAMLLTSACSNQDDAIINNENTIKKGYTLPVTVNVTRQGDGTRATYNESTKKLEFSTGDQLFVSGEDVSDGGAGKFAGRLTWQSGGTFSGTITTEKEWTGTADALFTAGGPSTTATLLPYRYGNYDYLSIKLNNGYDAVLNQTAANSIVTSKKLAVEQLSLESGSYTSGTGFTLLPLNAILNFTIGSSRASFPVEVKLKDNVSLTISGDVTTSSSGLATFAVGVSGTTDLNGLSLTVDGKDITLANSSKVLEAGKIYNIIRIPWSINGLFSVSATKKVVFSKGNLRCMKSGESWAWSFFSNQYDYYNAYNENNWDKFCWVGASGALNSEPDKWGISTSMANSDFGTNDDDKLKSDWGYRIGTGWRTPTKAKFPLKAGRNEVTVLADNALPGDAGFVCSIRWPSGMLLSDADSWKVCRDGESAVKPRNICSYGRGVWGRLGTASKFTSSPFAESVATELAFTLPALQPGERVYLACDDVEGEKSAAVTVNGAFAGGFIGKPYRLDITRSVKAGANALETKPFRLKKPRIVVVK